MTEGALITVEVVPDVVARAGEVDAFATALCSHVPSSAIVDVQTFTVALPEVGSKREAFEMQTSGYGHDRRSLAALPTLAMVQRRREQDRELSEAYRKLAEGRQMMHDAMTPLNEPIAELRDWLHNEVRRRSALPDPRNPGAGS